MKQPAALERGKKKTPWKLQSLGEFPEVKFETCPREGKEKPKKEADHSRLAGGCLISKEIYIQGSFWSGQHEVDLCTALPES